MAIQMPKLIKNIGIDKNDPPEIRLQKVNMVRAVIFFIPAGLAWGTMYFLLGESKAGLIPFLYGLFSILSVADFAIRKHFIFFRASQLLLILLLPCFLMWALGGFVNASAVILWAIICPLGALIFASPRRAIFWFLAFGVLIVISGFLQSSFGISVNLHPNTISFFFAANILVVSAAVFFMLYYFIVALQKERQLTNNLLLNVLPENIVPKLKDSEEKTIAEFHESVSVMFADVVGFTKLSIELTPNEMVELLNTIFTFFDKLVAKYEVEKIRTIGDNYMVVSGAPLPQEDHACRLVSMGIEMLDFLESDENTAGGRLKFRIGINSGPVIAGVIGTTKFHYDVWGDVVNTASRMESHGIPGKIQITEDTLDLLNDRFDCSFRGEIEVKGKGTMKTWIVVREKVSTP